MPRRLIRARLTPKEIPPILLSFISSKQRERVELSTRSFNFSLNCEKPHTENEGNPDVSVWDERPSETPLLTISVFTGYSIGDKVQEQQ